MGDRANVCIQDGGAPFYFYTHWGGSYLKNILANALTRGKSRWDDSPYLARIIFSEMIKNNVDGTTGYGISTSPAGDRQHDIITIYMDDQTVETGKILQTFQEFIDTHWTA